VIKSERNIFDGNMKRDPGAKENKEGNKAVLYAE